jgi:hypothetical protein
MLTMVTYTPKQRSIIAVAALLSTLATTSTILRFWARARTKQRLWWDDWLAMIALILSYALTADLVVG